SRCMCARRRGRMEVIGTVPPRLTDFQQLLADARITGAAARERTDRACDVAYWQSIAPATTISTRPVAIAAAPPSGAIATAVADLQRDGYCHLRGALDPALVQAANAAIDAVAAAVCVRLRRVVAARAVARRRRLRDRRPRRSLQPDSACVGARRTTGARLGRVRRARRIVRRDRSADDVARPDGRDARERMHLPVAAVGGTA